MRPNHFDAPGRSPAAANTPQNPPNTRRATPSRDSVDQSTVATVASEPMAATR